MLLIFLLLPGRFRRHPAGVSPADLGGLPVCKPDVAACVSAGAQLTANFFQPVGRIPAASEAPFRVGKGIRAAGMASAPPGPSVPACFHFRQNGVFKPLGLQVVAFALRKQL